MSSTPDWRASTPELPKSLPKLATQRLLLDRLSEATPSFGLPTPAQTLVARGVPDQLCGDNILSDTQSWTIQAVLLVFWVFAGAIQACFTNTDGQRVGPVERVCCDGNPLGHPAIKPSSGRSNTACFPLGPSAALCRGRRIYILFGLAFLRGGVAAPVFNGPSFGRATAFGRLAPHQHHPPLVGGRLACLRMPAPDSVQGSADPYSLQKPPQVRCRDEA